MTTAEKRDKTNREKLLKIIKDRPGTSASQIPMAQRRFLREFEKSGVLVCRDARWFVKS